MDKKKIYNPRTMKELEDYYYKCDGDRERIKRRTQYEDYGITEVYNPVIEGHAKKILENIGKPEKIPEKVGKKTFDYLLKNKKWLVEVKSIHTGLHYDKIDPTKKVRDVVNQILLKDASNYPGYYIGGFIYYLPWFRQRTSFHLLLNKELLTKSEVLNKRWDFLSFIHYPMDINNIESSDLYPTVIFTKHGSLNESLHNAFSDLNHNIISI